MRRLLFAVLVASCGGGGEPVRDVHIATLDAGAARPEKAHATKLGVPHDAAFVVSFDLRAAVGIDELRKALVHSLGVSDGTLTSHLDQLGLDTSRPATLAVSPVSSEQRKLIDDMLPLTASSTPTSLTEQTIARVLAIGDAIPIRLLLPAVDADLVEQTIAAWLGKEKSIAMTGDGKTVALDFGGGASRAPGVDGSDAPPALEGSVLRATWAPSALANAAFMAAVTRTCEAVSSEGIVPAQRGAIAAQGFYEAGRLLRLGAFHRVDVDLKLAPFDLTIRARPPSTYALPSVDVMAPSMSVALDGIADIESTRSLLGAWAFPGGDVTTTLSMIKDGGFAAWFVALPHVIASGFAPFLAQAYVGHGPRDASVVARFERTEQIWLLDHAATFVGILPAGTSLASAECALEPSTPCDPNTRLKLGGVVRPHSDYVKLALMNNRFVVLTSGEAASLNAKATIRTTTPVHVDISTAPLAPLFFASNPFPPHLTADLTIDSGTLLFHVTP